MKNDIESVRDFWDSHPLFTGEISTTDLASFFATHDRTYAEDVFRGIDPDKSFSGLAAGDRTLDVGCGIGFWVSWFEKMGVCASITGFDLSAAWIEIAQQRTAQVDYVVGNCEAMPFEDASFDFVNCQGVVHHTPDTQAALNEICRVLRPGGRASISVYYENALIKVAPALIGPIRLVSRLFLRDLGRNRDFSQIQSKDDIVRYYDGAENPVGKCYSASEFRRMLERAGFEDIALGYFFFPFRFLKIPIPAALSGPMVRSLPFMIVANLTKSEGGRSGLEAGH